VRTRVRGFIEELLEAELDARRIGGRASAMRGASDTKSRDWSSHGHFRAAFYNSLCHIVH
jgi:hypothetical protein